MLNALDDERVCYLNKHVILKAVFVVVEKTENTDTMEIKYKRR